MKLKCVGFIVLVFFAFPFRAICVENTVVSLDTSKGVIEIELFDREAPIGTKNFLNYVTSGFYNNVLFHRVIKGFMIQGGGFDLNMNRKQTHSPIKNEAKNGKKNLRGTLCYARTRRVNSATSQFFINLVNNPFLDYQNDQKYGYAVFGKVVKGMRVVDEIGGVKTGSVGMFRDVPLEPVIIRRAAIKR